MTPDRLRALRGWLGLSQAGLAALLGVNSRTVRRLEAGEIDIHGPTERLLWLLDRGVITVDDIPARR